MPGEMADHVALAKSPEAVANPPLMLMLPMTGIAMAGAVNTADISTMPLQTVFLNMFQLLR